ncbi:UvrD-helicase domain-containing protein [Neobacillus piezotolerans]|nr:UvrD-helicase domain-containing protein [Neobacillus piezotolerans]
MPDNSLFKTIMSFLILLRNKPALKRELQKMFEANKEIESIIYKIEYSPIFIPVEYCEEVKVKQAESIFKANQMNIFHSSKKAKEYIYRYLSESKSEDISRLEADYIVVCSLYLDKVNSLEVKIRETNEKLEQHYKAVATFNKLIEDQPRYISNSDFHKIKGENIATYTFFHKNNPNRSDVAQFLEIFKKFDKEFTTKYNEAFVKKELVEKDEFFSDIDGKSLDQQQRRAIITDEDGNLIVAGAGSGKTLTISGKVKYLVETKDVNPEEILLVSFTRKAAEEMRERIKNKLDIDVDVNTFHSLGRKIIAKEKSRMPDVEENAVQIIKGYFETEMYDDPTQLKRMIEYFGYYLNIPIDIEEFENLGQAFHYQKNLDLQTLRSKYEGQLLEQGEPGYFDDRGQMEFESIKNGVRYVKEKTEEWRQRRLTIAGEKVKSLEEVMVANFLFLNGIDYVYEENYPFNTATETYRQYKPDFYLPEYGIYIEHFGITKEGTAPWLSEFEERKYIEGIEWKRQVHNENQTELVETYSYWNKDGMLLELLRRRLLERGVEFKEVDFIDIFNKIYDTENSNHFDEFIKFITSFINLFKSNGYQAEMFDEFIKGLNNKNLFFYNRTKLFLEITKPVYSFYQGQLTKINKIDFNDMINLATDAVLKGKVNFPYKYIIIDEYQDVSVSRFNLINQIRKITGAKVLAVGDDWQSIFRFAGSDINLFTKFKKYFEHSEMLKIENTYRNSQELINVAGSFVMKNRKQISKNLTSNKRNNDPLKLYGYIGEEVYRTLKYVIEEIVEEYGEKAEIMLLGRNNFDIQVVGKDEEFKVIPTKDGVKIRHNKYPGLSMFFLTAHKSKGLEAENVIIINASNGNTGFPNRMADDPILSLVLTAPDEFLFAEERRLFYVAMTRTKNNTYILIPDMNMSSFVKELKDSYSINYKIIEGNTIVSDNPKCPRCIEGHLMLRENNSSKERFLGCSNYPLCEHTIKDIRVMENPIKCTSCGGYLVRRKGPRGEFYGCSNFKDGCRNTKDIKESITSWW